MLFAADLNSLASRREGISRKFFHDITKGGSKGGGIGAMPPQDAEVAFWSTAIILIQW